MNAVVLHHGKCAHRALRKSGRIVTATKSPLDIIDEEESPLGLAKVPALGALFWLIKVLTTGTGEAASDFLGSVSIPLAGIVGLGGFCIALWAQGKATRYVPYIYWFAVAMVALFGTMAADAVHLVGLPYAFSTSVYAITLASILFVWHRSEGTLSIHSITTRKREVFYWLTVLATFALGTAAGDLTADQMQLGFFASAVIFAVLITIPAIAYWKFGLNEIVAFWAAYVITRPLGASVADWLGKPAHRSGIGLGDGVVTAIGTILIVGCVAYITKYPLRHADSLLANQDESQTRADKTYSAGDLST